MIHSLLKITKIDYRAFSVVFLMIFVSDDTILFGTNSNNTFVLIRWVVYFALLLFFNNHTLRKLNKRSVFFVSLIVFSIISTMFLNKDFRNGYLLQLLVIILSFKLANSYSFNQIMSGMSDIIYLLSFISIIFYIIVFSIPSLLDILPTITNYADVEFSSIIICSIIKSSEFLRNSSVFREPGIFGMYIIVCLMYNMLVDRKLNIRKIVVFISALILTFSTASILIFFILIFAYIMQSRSYKIKLYIVIITSTFIVFLFPYINEFVFSKLNSSSADYASTLSRVSSLHIPLMIFKDNILGVGLTNFVELYKSYSVELYQIEFKPDGMATNTIVNTFVIYGVLFGVILIYAIWGLAKKYQQSLGVTTVIFLLYFLLLSSQELRFSLFVNLLIMYGLISIRTIPNKQK